MSIILNGTTGITTPDVTSDGSLKIDASAPDDSLVVNASGNVGIGTSSPTVYGSYKTLEVRGTGGGLLQFGTGANTAAYLYQDGTNSGFNNIANGVMTFGTNNTERARIDSSGNLLVGTTSPYPGYGNTNTGVQISGSGSTFSRAAPDYVMAVNQNTADGANHYQIVFRVANVTKGTIISTSTATSYNTTSDYRLKEDWVAVADASTRVNALKPVNFAWKVNGSRVDGFLAHELAEVVPEAVTGTKDAMRDEEYEVTPAILDDKGAVVTPAVMGTRSVPDYQGIDQSKLVPLLTAALQEALVKIDDLTARVSALEASNV